MANFKNIEDKCANQVAKKRATSYRFNVLPLSSICGWERLIFKKMFVNARCFVQR